MQHALAQRTTLTGGVPDNGGTFRRGLRMAPRFATEKIFFSVILPYPLGVASATSACSSGGNFSDAGTREAFSHGLPSLWLLSPPTFLRHNLWRIYSYNKMPAATAAFRLSARPGIGIVTRWAQAVNSVSGKPSASLPIKRTV